jgi:hypothetical protein
VPAGVAGVLEARFTPVDGSGRAFSGSLLLLPFAGGRIKQIASICVTRHADLAHLIAVAPVPVDGDRGATENIAYGDRGVGPLWLGIPAPRELRQN